MKVKCAWCGKDLGEKPPYGGRDGKYDKMVTHGMCDDCLQKQSGKTGDKKQEGGTPDG